MSDEGYMHILARKDADGVTAKQPRKRASSIPPLHGLELETVTLTLCNACLDGKGGECHTPGCALWMIRAPDVSIRAKVR